MSDLDCGGSFYAVGTVGSGALWCLSGEYGNYSYTIEHTRAVRATRQNIRIDRHVGNAKGSWHPRAAAAGGAAGVSKPS